MPKTEPFDKYSEEYDAWFEKNEAIYNAELSAIRRLLPVRGKGAEIGVGSGKFAFPLGIPFGVEPAAGMAEKARQLGIDVCRGVAEHLPFSDGCFDFLLMVTTICFVDDISQCLTEAFRVLKEKGSLVVGFIDGESQLGRQYAARKEHSRFYREATFSAAEAIFEHLEDAGFTINRTLQALIPKQPPEVILEGCGRGAFVAVIGRK